jgi:glycine cleavage system H protein
MKKVLLDEERTMILIYLTIFVFGFFFALDYFVKLKKRKEKVNVHALQLRKELPPISELIRNCKPVAPKGYFLSKRHIWINVLPHGEIKIGLDALCPKLMTRIDSINLHDPGDRVNKNGSMCAIYQGPKKLNFYSPIDGTIQEVNTGILENPEIVCEDPFEQGWIYRIKPSLQFSKIEVDPEMSDDALNWTEYEMKRLLDFFLDEPPARRQLEENMGRGRQILEGLLDRLDSFGWAKFQENFLA